MKRLFESSRLKVQRAEKHIHDLYMLLENVPTKPNFHSVFIREVNAQWDVKDLVIEINYAPSHFLNEVAVIIGDVLHNLRSALDILYCDVIKGHKGAITKWTRFPVFDTREKLEAKLNEALKQKRICNLTVELILNAIKPYKTGNFLIWSLHDMNIMDKHELLIPTFQMMGISGIRLYNDEGVSVEFPTVFMDANSHIRLGEEYGRNTKLHEKGRAAIGIGFKLGTPYDGQPVLPALNAIAEEVSRTIEAFRLMWA